MLGTVLSDTKNTYSNYLTITAENFTRKPNYYMFFLNIEGKLGRETKSVKLLALQKFGCIILLHSDRKLVQFLEKNKINLNEIME